MTRVEQRYFLNSLLLGICLTALVAAVDYFGNLEQLERWFYDVRARNCQVFNPPPTDKLIHLDIDDRALDSIGAWPWRRTVLAEILDEIRIAGARAVAMDVIFPEPQEIDYEIIRQEDGTEIVRKRIDHDANFAEVIERSHNVLLPAALGFQQEVVNQSIVDLLCVDLELTEEQVASQLTPKGMESAQVSDDFLPARRRAMRLRVEDSLKQRELSLDQLRERLLPRTDPSLSNSSLIAVLESQYNKVQAIRALRRFTRPLEPAWPPLLKASIDLPPILPLSQASVSGGFVDYIPFSDGVLRSVPLWVEVDGQMYPQMGMALACMMLGTDPHDLEFEEGELVIPLPEGAKRIPVRSLETAKHGAVGTLLDVPWWGKDDWSAMYDHPDYREPSQHASIALAWDICNMRRTIARNNASIDKAVEAMSAYIAPDAGEAYASALPPLQDTIARLPIVTRLLQDLADSPLLTMLEELDNRTESEELDYRALVNAKTTLEKIPERNAELQELANRSRVEFSELVRGRAVLIGWIATGRSDLVPTSLHPLCPGVIVHGAIFNAIMTDNYWRFAPKWVTLVTTFIVGLLTTLAVGLLTPSRAILAAMLLSAGYLSLNGFVLFDYGNRVVGVAGPMIAIAVVWAGCTLTRLLAEAIQRNRIKKRFEHYVDPKLVNYLLEHPDEDLDGEMREMTVVFTDLAGFTTLSERLHERTVELLNEFLNRMVPIIRDRHGGYLDKFLGDGIMFFFGAPLKNDRHAADAVSTVLEMLNSLGDFNQSLVDRGLPTLSLRAGISTGDMVVGDTGSEDAGSYTVLGDSVNFGARLESANKALGTGVLMSHRTMEMTGDEFLVRPVGLIQVVGKTEGVYTYELLDRMDRATPEQKRLADISRRIVDAFRARRFNECLTVLAEMEGEFGPSRFVSLYRELAEQYLREPPGDNFDGKVILSEK